MHTSSSWSGTINSSVRPFSAWSDAIVTISSARAAAMPPSEAPGATFTTHAGSYTSSAGSVVVVEVLAGAVVGATVTGVTVVDGPSPTG